MSKGHGRAFLYAILVHVVVFLVLGISFDWQLTPSSHYQIDDKTVVQATLVDGGKVQKELDRIKKKKAAKRSAAKKEKARLEKRIKQAALAEKKRKVEKKRLVELKKKQVLAKKKKALEKKKKIQETKKRRQSKAKRLDEKKKQEQANKKRKQQARLAVERKRRKAEKALQAQLRKEQLQRQAQGELNKYEPLIRQRVQGFWIRPPGAQTGLKAVLRVRLTPSGEVLTVRVVQSSGNAIFDRSVENAVKKATPLPLPSNPELAEFFSVIDFEFDPQKGR